MSARVAGGTAGPSFGAGRAEAGGTRTQGAHGRVITSRLPTGEMQPLTSGAESGKRPRARNEIGRRGPEKEGNETEEGRGSEENGPAR